MAKPGRILVRGAQRDEVDLHLIAQVLARLAQRLEEARAARELNKSEEKELAS